MRSPWPTRCWGITAIACLSILSHAAAVSGQAPFPRASAPRQQPAAPSEPPAAPNDQPTAPAGPADQPQQQPPAPGETPAPTPTQDKPATPTDKPAAPQDKPATPPAPAAPTQISTSSTYTTTWSLPLAADGPLTLTFAPDIVIVAGPDTSTEARALADGGVVWTSEERLTRPVRSADRLVGISGDRLVALNVADGTGVWALPLSGSSPGPVASEDVIYFSDGSFLRAHASSDGAPVWQYDLGAQAIVQPAFDDAMLVVALDDRTLAAFERRTGRPLWRTTIQITTTSITVSGDRLYLGASEGYACAHKREHGRKDWCFQVRVPPAGPPAADDRYVYFAFRDNLVHVFDRESGRRFFTASLHGLPAGGPVLTPSAVIVPMVTGEFVLLNPSDGFSARRVSSPRAAELPTTRGTAIAPDGAVLAMAIGSPSGRSLMVFERSASAAPPQTGGTASDTPPAPPAP